MVKSLHKVDVSHSTGHYTWKTFSPPPLEKILGTPLCNFIIMHLILII